jgi:hypothetical protein
MILAPTLQMGKARQGATQSPEVTPTFSLWLVSPLLPGGAWLLCIPPTVIGSHWPRDPSPQPIRAFLGTLVGVLGENRFPEPQVAMGSQFQRFQSMLALPRVLWAQDVLVEASGRSKVTGRRHVTLKGHHQ